MGSLSGSQTNSRFQFSGRVEVVILQGINLGRERIHSISIFWNPTKVGFGCIFGRLLYTRGCLLDPHQGCGCVAQAIWRAWDGKE